MKKAGAIATRFNVHPDTIRVWTDTFEEFFSPGARKGAGIRRIYTPEDEMVLNTIHELRKQNVEMEEIRARLTSGERIEVLPAVNEPVPETAVEIYGKIKILEKMIEERDKEIERMRAERETDKQQLIQMAEEVGRWKTRYQDLKADLDAREKDE